MFTIVFPCTTWTWRQKVSSKRWFVSAELQDVTSHNTIILILTTGWTLYLIKLIIRLCTYGMNHNLALKRDYFQMAYRFVSRRSIRYTILPVLSSLLLTHYVEVSLWQVLVTLSNDMTACSRLQVSLAFYFHLSFIDDRDMAYLHRLVNLWQLLILVYSFFISVFCFLACMLMIYENGIL
jgi:hypothetical protein